MISPGNHKAPPRAARSRSFAKATVVVGGIVALAWLIGGWPVASHGTARVTAMRPRTSSLGAPANRPEAALHETVSMREGESLPRALAHAGVGAREAAAAAAALADDFDVVNAHPGQRLDIDRAAGPSRQGERALVRLSLGPRAKVRVELWRGGDGAFRLQRSETRVYTQPDLVQGAVDGSLYLSIVGAGVRPDAASRIEGLFARRLDLTRDIQSGDRFRLLFEQRRLGDGRAMGAPSLIYADITTRAGERRIYRLSGPDGPGDFVDDGGDPAPAHLLRTPVGQARITSLFGMRLHPILGFTRMHEGVDFGAPSGAPVFAAGDGVVEEARWSGGYGRWLRIRHASGLETGYAHLSDWAAGVGPGARVRQGQVVAFVGSSGLATGPHLHFEVFQDGQRIDPRLADAVVIAARAPASDTVFRARKASIDAQLTMLEPPRARQPPSPASRVLPPGRGDDEE
jgi:murein DD-endopeptidase MepM/ murein hydrolase activator NlpD